ncbi:Helix-turn-helix domain-containing protein [Myroides marinus]|uniref:Helix-turn-helix domain-containing protein n=1 Tax=Myroides marinus TaxID=703342 RepID=A0A1H6Y9T4_9FLAO|nr:helix-turn-helix domain-containing protein [Myroides marinus]SEJ38009.1 Helix-turn-helix domain-containing protein [Myroides marinus]
MSYKLEIGQKLKKKREELGYTQGDIVYMTKISKSSIIKIENGKTTNMDFYFLYAVTVELSLQSLLDVKIDLAPKRKLTETRSKAIKLTMKIKNLISENFFNTPKTVADIKKELLEKELIDISLKSGEISNVLRNIEKEKGIKVIRDGKINRYKEILL